MYGRLLGAALSVVDFILDKLRRPILGALIAAYCLWMAEFLGVLWFLHYRPARAENQTDLMYLGYAMGIMLFATWVGYCFGKLLLPRLREYMRLEYGRWSYEQERIRQHALIDQEIAARNDVLNFWKGVHTTLRMPLTERTALFSAEYAAARALCEKHDCCFGCEYLLERGEYHERLAAPPRWYCTAPSVLRAYSENTAVSMWHDGGLAPFPDRSRMHGCHKNGAKRKMTIGAEHSNKLISKDCYGVEK